MSKRFIYLAPVRGVEQNTYYATNYDGTQYDPPTPPARLSRPLPDWPEKEKICRKRMAMAKEGSLYDTRSRPKSSKDHILMRRRTANSSPGSSPSNSMATLAKPDILAELWEKAEKPQVEKEEQDHSWPTWITPTVLRKKLREAGAEHALLLSETRKEPMIERVADKTKVCMFGDILHQYQRANCEGRSDACQDCVAWNLQQGVIGRPSAHIPGGVIPPNPDYAMKMLKGIAGISPLLALYILSNIIGKAAAEPLLDTFVDVLNGTAVYPTLRSDSILGASFWLLTYLVSPFIYILSGFFSTLVSALVFFVTLPYHAAFAILSTILSMFNFIVWDLTDSIIAHAPWLSYLLTAGAVVWLLYRVIILLSPWTLDAIFTILGLTAQFLSALWTGRVQIWVLRLLVHGPSICLEVLVAAFSALLAGFWFVWFYIGVPAILFYISSLWNSRFVHYLNMLIKRQTNRPIRGMAYVALFWLGLTGAITTLRWVGLI